MKSRTFTLLLQKLSRSTGSRTKVTKAPPRQTDNHTSPITSTFLLLPTELLIQILSAVPFPYLCYFRRTCQYAAYTLLDSPDIVHPLIEHHVSPQLIHLYPPSSTLSFTYLLEQHRRQHIATSLATSLGLHVHRALKIYFCPYTSRPLWTSKLSPLLIVLQHYLESLGELWLTLPIMPIAAPQSFEDVFASREAEIFSKYSTAEVAEVNMLWQFLVWMLRYPFRGPTASRKGPFAPVNDRDLDTYLLFGNVRGILPLLEMKPLDERRREIKSFVTSLDPERNVHKWRESWQAHSPRLNSPGPDELQVQGALTMKRGRHDIWTKCARSMLADKGYIADWREIMTPVGTAAQAAEFLREVTNFNFTQGRTLLSIYMHGHYVMGDGGYFGFDYWGDNDDPFA